MPSSDDHGLRTYGDSRAPFVVLGTGIVGLVFLLLVPAVLIEQAAQGAPLELPRGWPVILALSATILMYPVLGFLMYSPRTKADHITADTGSTAPALVLRQSSWVFGIAFVQIGAFTLMLLGLIWLTGEPDEQRLDINVVLAVLARRREGRLIGRHLQLYGSTGWLAEGEVVMLASLPARREARRWAAQVGGPEGHQAMRQFQVLGSELAFLRERMVRGTAASDALQQEHAMLTTMARLRDRFTPRWPRLG